MPLASTAVWGNGLRCDAAATNEEEEAED